MNNTIQEKLQRSFGLYQDLIEFLSEETLAKKLPGLPSNELGQQLWCVVGARNSYLKALEAGQWQGFECPMKWEETTSKKSVAGHLKSTAENLQKFLDSDADYSESIMLDLLEHEIVHQGQIIRYLYGFKIGVPDSWKKRYNLD